MYSYQYKLEPKFQVLGYYVYKKNNFETPIFGEIQSRENETKEIVFTNYTKHLQKRQYLKANRR
jgi:hypothetical protein